MSVRIIHLLLIVCALFAGVPGCKKAGHGEKGVIRFVTWKPNQPEVWAEVIRRFEASHPGLRVKTEVGPHSSTAYHDLLTQKLKNRDPSVDVFFMDVIWPPEFAAAGWARPLDDLFPPEKRRDFLPAPILANTYRGKIYGVPVFTDGGLLFYRKDLLEKYGFAPPETWQEMVEQARIIVDGERKSNPDIWGYSGQFKQYEGLVCNMMEYIMSNGGALTEPETGTPRITEKAAVEAVRFVRDEIIGKAAPRGVLTYQEPESLTFFIQGKAVFMRNWPYAWEAANDPGRSKIASKIGITTLPSFPGDKSASALGGWQLGISRYSKKTDPAWKFVEFVSSPETQRFLALSASLAPTRTALYSDAKILATHPWFEKLKKVFLSARPRPRTPFYPAVSHTLQRYFSKAVSFPDSDIEALAEEANKEIGALVEKYSGTQEG